MAINYQEEEFTKSEELDETGKHQDGVDEYPNKFGSYEDVDLPTWQEVIKDSAMQPVGASEIRRSFGLEREEWRAAIASELESFKEKAVFATLSQEEAKQVKKKDILPMKAVAGIKPVEDPVSNRRRKKFRAVVCGNWQPRKPGEDNYASVVEASSLRLALAIAVQRSWSLKPLDVTTAFLDAELPEDMEDIYLMPPSLMVHFGLVKPGTVWKPLKGVYGLRIAPKAWGVKRDRVCREVRFMINGVRHRLLQSRSDSSVWLITPEQDPHIEADRQVTGMMLIYVDDFLLMGPPAAILALEAVLMARWKMSSQEMVDLMHPGSVRYLGVEIEVDTLGSVFIHQKTYIKDMLKKWDMENAKGSSSLVVDAPTQDELDADSDPAEVTLAQRLGGGLLWAATRSRPDISYAVSRLGSHCTSAPLWALALGKRVMRYLVATMDWCISFAAPLKIPGKVVTPPKFLIRGFADAGFEPDFAQSGIVVFAGNALVEWRSVKQQQPARSTAEAEVTALQLGTLIIEGVESVITSMGVSIETSELHGDNSASLALVKGQGSWRTRALSNRASATRARVDEGSLKLIQVASEAQLADGLTKSFSGPNMQKVRKQLSMAVYVGVGDVVARARRS